MKNPAPKLSIHPRNFHQGRYDLETLVGALPELKTFIFTNEFGNQTIDFSNPEAVKILNRALLKKYYQVVSWDIPDGFLCPPIPGRADYIHHLADLLAPSNVGKLPKPVNIRVLDIGTGANLIYPLLGAAIYDWRFVGSELNPIALNSAKSNLDNNPNFQEKIELRGQNNPEAIFEGIIQQEEFFDLTLCNPPFHESAEAAQEGSRRKIRNLTGKDVSKAKLNFGGQSAELWTEGGELEFIRKMILESSRFKSQVFWFTTLVSKSENLKPIEAILKNAGVAAQKTVPMTQGNKQSRFVAWTFLNPKQREDWSKFRWSK
ncbi:23S rRNA (adenine(1618)-N(6))-methyltransferase RlmF [Algoriphagus sp. A40]|uniref:23S rRNA (adenine(1618)-N(6))-methyltransferase RlmF n=1 Tax=Algoriphagus sp. A40 TaxID=1945863 RepID=UPI0009851FED|nr:23S rRNA (adenine(1618)-N(6))-methyltransferase RlmF [Algoriphagus sp. A40]OOG70545.1 23S rRNA (adenine(1618)-N(6))-methyltransferase [Algoriphagus sp. A40]